MPFTSAARQHLSPAPRTASVVERTRCFSVFDADESLVAEVWINGTGERARDIARRRAHQIREMIEQE